MHRVKGNSGSFLLAIMVIAADAAAQSTTPLPRLSTDAYPPAARVGISQAYVNATAHTDDPDAVGALARVLQAWQQWEPAHQVYGRAQVLAPRTFEWHYLDAVVLQRLARYGDAVSQLTQAIALSGAYLPARVRLADAFFDSGDLEQSGKLFLDLTREPAAEPAAQLGLGRIAAVQGRHEAAIAHFERAIALFPEFGAAYYALARSYRSLGRMEEARRALERHTEYGPKWPGIDDPVLSKVLEVREDAGALLQRGVKWADANDVPRAIAAHEAALARDPSMGQAHANLISLYGRAENWAKAEEHYRATLHLGFNVDEAHYNYGVLLGIQGNWDAAAEAYRKALAINPLHARARNNLGQILERQQQIEAAATEYRQAVALQPTFRLARFNLGRMLLATGHPKEAVAELERLIEPRDAETPRYLFALATALIRSGHTNEGIRWATDARELALAYGQSDLAAAIERDLALIK